MDFGLPKRFKTIVLYDIPGLDPTKEKSKIQFFRINLKILNPQIILDKSKKIESNFLLQLAGQISENNIQEFLVRSQYPKPENLVKIPEIFLTFLLVGSSPGVHFIKTKRQKWH